MPKRIRLVLLLLAPLAKIATAPRLNKTPSHQLKTFFPIDTSAIGRLDRGDESYLVRSDCWSALDWVWA